VERLPTDPLDLPPLTLTNIAKDTTIEWLLKRFKRRAWCENKDWESASEDTIYDIWLPCDVVEYQKVKKKNLSKGKGKCPNNVPSTQG